MKLKVRIEFDIEGDEVLNEDELKEMIYNYVAEAIESGELEYDVEAADEDELN